MNTQSPYEQIKFIRDVIKDRTDKSQATFFSVKLESFGNITPLVEKDNGANFYDTIIQYLTRYDIAAIIIELYHGKSHNIKEPFQTFRIILKKTANITLSGVDKREDTLNPHQETIISPEKHFQTLAENNFNLLRLQYENDVLKKKNKKRKHYIKELEGHIEKLEKDKKGGLGNVALGSVASNALENFAKSDFGIAILTKAFGIKSEVLQGIVGETKEPAQVEGANSKAEIIKEPEKELTEKEKVRKQIKDFINNTLDTADDGTLRLYYEIINITGTNLKLLQAVYVSLKKHSEKAEQPQAEGSLKKVELNGSGEDNEEVDDTS